MLVRLIPVLADQAADDMPTAGPGGYIDGAASKSAPSVVIRSGLLVA
jgi:hypothetical protein